MYTAEISRNNPALLLFLVDCSYSMSEKYGNTGMSKGQYLAQIANDSIDQVILSCEKGDEIRAYFEIGMLGYGEGAIEILPVQSIIDLANNPLELGETELDGVKIQKPVWIKDPTREWNTDMLAGLEKAKSVLTAWTEGHKSSFPPVLIHVSDGQWTGGNPIALAQSIISDVYTDDGAAIVMNVHISNEEGSPEAFPATEPANSDFAKGLFAMSSVLPDSFLDRAKEKYPHVAAGARGYMFNARPEDMSRFFDIGTRLKG